MAKSSKPRRVVDAADTVTKNVFPSDVAAFLALVDEIRHVPNVPTLATVLKDGRLTLLLGQMWERGSHAVRTEMLRHEASHVAHGCWMRMGERNPATWNDATDAIIHALGECDWQLVDREMSTPEQPFMSATLDRLGQRIKRTLGMMPAEHIYDLLQQHGQGQGGCGSAACSRVDDTFASRLKAQAVGAAVLGNGGTGGNGYRGVPALPPVPEWIGQVLDWLVTKVVAREDRVRSWRRESRVSPTLLPGSARGETRAARFMLDASGSIGDDLLGQLLAAVCSTHELVGSDVVVFDHTIRDPVPASDVGAVLESCRTAGGGTFIRAAGAARDPEMQTVWLTDGGTTDGWPEQAERDLWVVGVADPVPRGASIVRRSP